MVDCLRRFTPLELHKGILNSFCLLILLIHTKHKHNKMQTWTDATFSFPSRRTHQLGRQGQKRVTNVRWLPLKAEWWDAPLALQAFTQSNLLYYLCRHFCLTYSLVSVTEPAFLPFLNNSSAQKWKETKI